VRLNSQYASAKIKELKLEIPGLYTQRKPPPKRLTSTKSDPTFEP